jgi:hypothetical protein
MNYTLNYTLNEHGKYEIAEWLKSVQSVRSSLNPEAWYTEAEESAEANGGIGYLECAAQHCWRGYPATLRLDAECFDATEGEQA